MTGGITVTDMSGSGSRSGPHSTHCFMPSALPTSLSDIPSPRHCTRPARHAAMPVAPLPTPLANVPRTIAPAMPSPAARVGSCPSVAPGSKPLPSRRAVGLSRAAAAISGPPSAPPLPDSPRHMHALSLRSAAWRASTRLARAASAEAPGRRLPARSGRRPRLTSPLRACVRRHGSLTSPTSRRPRRRPARPPRSAAPRAFR